MLSDIVFNNSRIRRSYQTMDMDLDAIFQNSVMIHRLEVFVNEAIRLNEPLFVEQIGCTIREYRVLKIVDEYGGIEEALAWTAERAELGSDWHVLYLGEAPSTYDTLLRQWLIGDGEEAGSGGDVIARMTQSRSAFVARIAADADRLLGTRGVQAYCLACPAPQPAAAQDQAATGWLARIVQLVSG